MGNIKPIFYEIDLYDGTKAPITRNYGALYLLKAYNEKLYAEAQTLKNKKQGEALDDLETAGMVYASYVAAKLLKRETESIMPREEFYTLCPNETEETEKIIKTLYGVKEKDTKGPLPGPLNGKPAE